MVDLTGQAMPSALRQQARWERLGDSDIPALLVHPTWSSERLVPTVIWLHGRTVNKELDPGRYLRWMRNDIATCAVDLPGHGERFDATLQQPTETLHVVKQMAEEIDSIVQSLRRFEVFDPDRMAIGGMSAGGMAALVRLCRRHPFVCASVEATSGSWEHQKHREMFQSRELSEWHAIDPMRNLDGWREIPFQAIHAEGDAWMNIDGQRAFVDALREQYREPALIELVTFEKTGAPYEHVGFGNKTLQAKTRQVEFLKDAFGNTQ